jgi:hypothetical protein
MVRVGRPFAMATRVIQLTPVSRPLSYSLVYDPSEWLVAGKTKGTLTFVAASPDTTAVNPTALINFTAIPVVAGYVRVPSLALAGVQKELVECRHKGARAVVVAAEFSSGRCVKTDAKAVEGIVERSAAKK